MHLTVELMEQQVVVLCDLICAFALHNDRQSWRHLLSRFRVLGVIGDIRSFHDGVLKARPVRVAPVETEVQRGPFNLARERLFSDHGLVLILTLDDLQEARRPPLRHCHATVDLVSAHPRAGDELGVLQEHFGLCYFSLEDSLLSVQQLHLLMPVIDDPSHILTAVEVRLRRHEPPGSVRNIAFLREFSQRLVEDVELTCVVHAHHVLDVLEFELSFNCFWRRALLLSFTLDDVLVNGVVRSDR